MEDLVTVIMLSYNHGEWIDKALNGVVSQKTNFKFSVIVHDDASTDNSKEIIRLYEKKYPSIIHPIYQDVNQYSRHVGIVNNIIFPKIKSKYIAFCECDDYWTDINKLQRQIEYMENNDECSLCFSNGYKVDTSNHFVGNFLPTNFWNDKQIIKKLKSNNEENFKVEEMLLLDFIPTASVVCRCSKYQILVKEFEDTFDLVVRIVCTYYGYAHYFPDKMVAYRTGNPNSASGRAAANLETRKKFYYERHRNFLEHFDKYSDFKYHGTIQRVIERKLVECYLGAESYCEAKKMNVYRELLLNKRFKMFIRENFKSIYKLLKRLKGLYLNQRNKINN